MAGRQQAKAEATGARYGFAVAGDRWQDLVADPAVQLLDNCAPNHLHREPCLAAIRAGKHVFCEKPLGRSAAEARELDANPRASLCFHWAVLQRQVRVSGSVERVSAEESEEYFATRGRGSQLGAWASKQSQDLSSRGELEGRVTDMEAEFAGRDVSRPPFWGGYRLTPSRIEFWQGRADRLHDRLVFTRTGDGWSTRRLYP